MSESDSEQPAAPTARPDLEPVFCEIRREMLALSEVDVLELLGGAQP